MPLLELKDVHARYGPIRALHGVSLTVDEGEVVALLGANGAGKTTTLRSISSMTRTSGDIVFDGHGIARRSPEYAARLGIAHVPEGRGLFPELTVWENLRMGAVGPGRGRGARLEEEAKRVVGYFPWIDRRRDQPAATLSGGEQQMLALGRALVSRPRSASPRASRPTYIRDAEAFDVLRLIEEAEAYARLPARAARARPARLRRAAAADHPAADRAAEHPAPLPGPVPARPRRRVPGRQHGPDPAAGAGRPRAGQAGQRRRGRRRRPVDLSLPRRQLRGVRAVRGALRERADVGAGPTDAPRSRASHCSRTGARRATSCPPRAG